MALREYQAFREPSPYEQERMRAERLRRYAELLEQQAAEPEGEFTYQGIRAMPSPAAALGKMLQAYSAKKAGEKAEEAQRKQTGMEEEASSQIMGRLMGGRTPDTIADLTEVTPAGKIGPASEADLTGVQLESQYTRSPEDAMRVAMTPQGMGAMRRNPMLAAALQKSMEAEKEPKSPYGSIDPSKFTTASLQKFDASVRSGKPDYTVLQSREYAELTPQQMADLALKVGQFGIEGGKYAYETGQTAPSLSLPRFPFQSQSAAEQEPAAARPSATPTATAPTVAAPTAAAPTAAAPTTRRDTIAAAVDETEKKQPSAFEVATPKQRQVLQQEFPKARQAAQVGLAKLDQLDDYLSDLEQHKGTENITGLFGQIPIDIAPESRSARSVLEGFQQGASIQAINEARQASETGGAYGNMTVQEWPRLEGVFGAVVAAKDPEAFDVAIKNARKQIAAARGRYESSWKATYGDMDIGYKRSEYTPESRQYPRNKPKSDVRNRADAILRGE
jgi:hypothetical protein